MGSKKELGEQDWIEIAAQQINAMDEETKAEWADLHRRYT